jgi:hypothetical protein
MSSDLCEFNDPIYTMSGASRIVTGTTVSDDNIHIIDSGTTIDLTFSFTGNVDTFIDVDSTTFKYNIYPYNYDIKVFTSPPIFQSGDIEWSGFSGASAFTDTLLVSEFIVDGEYLVKGSYDFLTCTDYLNALEDSNDTALPLIGTQYGIYDENFDNYFAMISKAIKPKFELTPTDTRQLGALTVESTIVDGDVNITTTSSWAGSPIVSLNGLTLAEGVDDDFTTDGDTISFNSPINLDDVITVAYVNSGNANGLLSESLIVTDPIASGATDGEGSNVYYYNTDISRYEIYMLSEPLEFNDVIVTLNGVTLAINLDYYQSTENSKRIILKGLIYDTDVITITYNSFGSYVGTIYVDNFDVYWTITPAPTNDTGMFTLLVAEDDTFSTAIYSATTQYVTNDSTYSVNVDLNGYTGSTVVYKVINQKDFTLITGDIITTITDSDIIPITLDL